MSLLSMSPNGSTARSDHWLAAVYIQYNTTNQYSGKKYWKLWEENAHHNNQTDQNNYTWRRRTDKELWTKTGQSILHDFKARRLRSGGLLALTDPLGSHYTTIKASIVGKRPHGMPKTSWIDQINRAAHVENWKAILQDEQLCCLDHVEGQNPDG